MLVPGLDHEAYAALAAEVRTIRSVRSYPITEADDLARSLEDTPDA